MKIIKLTAENLKRLQAVEITPSGHLVKISGRNAQGKSSVLDAIWYALGGGDALPAKPIRDGAEAAKVTLDLGDLVVTRRFTAAGSRLLVQGKDGARFPSPQGVLDRLIGRLAFDPLAFLRLDPKRQADTLRDLVELDEDLEALDAERERAYQERTTVNREVKQLDGRLAGFELPADTPTEEISASDLLERLQQTLDAQRDWDQCEQRLIRTRQTYQQCQSRIETLERQLREARDQLAELADAGRALAETLERQPRPDTSGLQAQLADIEARNARARQARERADVHQQLSDAQQRSQALTDRIGEIDRRKAAAIRSARFPLDGLGFDGHTVTYRGLPLDQASRAEQLRVSMAIAMAANPRLRVIRITDGSLLDSDSLALIEAMAAAGDYQVWLETVDETGAIGIVIEDGRVAAVNDAPPARARA